MVLMSSLSNDPSRQLPFYLSGPLPCPYREGLVERKLFTRLTGGAEKDAAINAFLTRAGFRRSQNIMYRPACPACNACLPVRIPVERFAPSTSMRRTARRNRDLKWEAAEAPLTDTLYDLFIRYQRARHTDGDMASMTRDDLAAMLQDGTTATRLYTLRAPSGALMGSILTDDVQDGPSAIYSFFDPDESPRSLGTQLVLSLVEEARRQKKPYVYLGYWIEASRKMAYKGRFRPLEVLGAGGWGEITPQKEADLLCAIRRLQH